jgi:hypothetical protein
MGWKYIKNVTLCTRRMHRKSPQLCQIGWLQRHGLEVVHNDPIFLPTSQRVLPELCLIAPCVFPPVAVPHILF